MRRPNGFTLLEMSIVIVIIGLLVGGVVAAQSYIANARLTTMMNEAKYYINTFNQFQGQYNSPPGDLATASSIWPAAFNGDGNGLINAGTNTAEIFYVFQHLAFSGFIPGTYTGATTGGGGTFYASAHVNLPASSFPGAALMFDHPGGYADALTGYVHGDSLYFDGQYNHVLRIAGLGATDNALPAKVFLTPQQTYQIDDKFDDGAPGTGWVTTPNTSALGNCATSATAYTTSYKQAGCYLLLRLQ